MVILLMYAKESRYTKDVEENMHMDSLAVRMQFSAVIVEGNTQQHKADVLSESRQLKFN